MFLVGCSQEQKMEVVEPFALTDSAMGRYCGMNVLEHPGPKGQIILSPANEPVWFSSARDTLAFTMLPEEPKSIAAIYVSDMARAPSWEEPGAENWVDARKAFFVIESNAVGGMGAQEAVPFSTREAADQFITEKGGRVVGFEDVPQDYILGEQAPVAEAAHDH
ncbi:nitrous oxide reductase accessory protein NosL [Brucella sp. BE17]|uniref:nitrous oxide reductase accessory protein NosL n=1 Tax=Brucella sp. BE17 TaxID=3142977 RepID=UPI0031BBA15C